MVGGCGFGVLTGLGLVTLGAGGGLLIHTPFEKDEQIRLFVHRQKQDPKNEFLICPQACPCNKLSNQQRSTIDNNVDSLTIDQPNFSYSGFSNLPTVFCFANKNVRYQFSPIFGMSDYGKFSKNNGSSPS